MDKKNDVNEMDKKEFIETEIKSDSLLKKTIQSILRWVLIVLGSILIGGLLVFFTLYYPAQQELGLADTNLRNARETMITQAEQIASLKTENEIQRRNLENSNETIITQDEQIASLETILENANEIIISQDNQIASLQTENETLQTTLVSTTLHLDVVNTLSGLRGASLAVVANDYVGARLYLFKASEVLDTLSRRLGTDQKDVFSAMQKSASLALIDVQKNLKSAKPELDQLINNLLQLEDNLFSTP